jgi:hypothetical protein
MKRHESYKYTKQREKKKKQKNNMEYNAKRFRKIKNIKKEK